MQVCVHSRSPVGASLLAIAASSTTRKCLKKLEIPHERSRRRSTVHPTAHQPRPLVAVAHGPGAARCHGQRSEEHTSELQSLMRISYAVFCLKKKKQPAKKKSNLQTK